MAGEVRIISDGKPWGTWVYVGDNVIPGVVSVTWVSEEGSPPLATITIEGAEIDARVLPENTQITPVADAVETADEGDGDGR